MPKINVYLPDDLAERVKAAGIPVSAVCQRALEDALNRTADLSHFTNRARKVMQLARDAGRQRQQAEVGTEHLLLGILDEGGNLGLQVLKNMKIDPESVRTGIEEVMAGPSANPEENPPFSPSAQHALEHALSEALRLSHNYIGCEHLLLGLLQEPEGKGGRILQALGVDYAAARRTTVQALAGYTKPATQMDEIVRRLEALEARLQE
jgi:ATP-dependent Clp protease ATP-binding subunit ClpA